jgi:hypothetical protein
MANAPSHAQVAASPNVNRWLEQWASQLAGLPEEDWPLVFDFVEHLKQRRETLRRKALVAEIQAAARQRAKELESVPREQIVARFDQLIEEIRQTAIAKGTAIEGDWESD